MFIAAANFQLLPILQPNSSYPLEYFCTCTKISCESLDHVSFLIHFSQMSPAKKTPANQPEVKLKLCIYTYIKQIGWLWSGGTCWEKCCLRPCCHFVVFCTQWQHFCSKAYLTPSFPVSLSWPPTYIIYTLYTVTVSTGVSSRNKCVRSNFLPNVLCMQSEVESILMIEIILKWSRAMNASLKTQTGRRN